MNRKWVKTAIGVLALGLVLAPISSAFAKNKDKDDESYEDSEFTFTLDDGFDISDDEIEIQSDLFPDGEPVYFTGKKLKTDKALSVKVKKVDGDYELVLKDSDKSSNYAGLKLSYNRKKGTVKGSFKVYGVQEYETKKGVTKMKLKKYTVKISGTFDGSEGYGTASSSKLGTSEFSID
ncbi:MAG: hypothetical protein MJ240_00055 [Kiritimatiellae bacterium]|nr:hypothetical protein [Kiritimatiellia bacterium]